MPQLRQRLRPELPQRPQHLGTGAKVHHRPAQGPQDHEAPQLSLPPLQQEGEGRRPDAQAVAPVQHAGAPGPAQPKGPQQVVEHSGGQAQQDRLGKGQKLLGDLVAHYPKRRLKKPPRPWLSSS